MSQTPDADAGGQSSGARNALLLLFFINLLNFYDRTVIYAIAEPIRMEFGLSDGAIGWLGTGFILVYAAVGLPFGRWADRGNRPRLLAMGVAVWSGFTALGGVAWNYLSLFVARMGVGVGEASCSPAANSLIGDLFPPHRRARAVSVFMLGLPMGVMLSGVVSGIIAKAYGWRAALFVAAVPGIIITVLAARLPDPPRGSADALDVPRADHGFWKNITLLLGIPTFRWIIITGALHNFNAYAINSFMPAYLGRYHGLDLQQANVTTGLMLGGLGMASLIVAGFAADRARQWRANGRMILATLALGLSVPCVFLALNQSPGQPMPFIIWMGLGWMLSYVYYSTVYTSVHDVIPPELRGSAMSLFFFCMYVLGGAFGTSMLGMLSDFMARRAMTLAEASEMSEPFRAIGLHDAFQIVPILSIVLTLALAAASFTISRDLQQARAR